MPFTSSSLDSGYRALYNQLSSEHKKVIVHGRVRNNLRASIIACMPKSGSTWLTSLFNNLPSYQSVHMVPIYGAREQELESQAIERAFQLNPTDHLISQIHVKYNKNTRILLLLYCMRPIVLTRSIKDNLVSLVDHWRIFGPLPNFNLYIQPDYFSSDLSTCRHSSATPLEYAARLHTPWIINFFLSWSKFEISPFSTLPSQLHPIFVSYEALQKDTFSTFSSLLSQLGMSYSESQILSAIKNSDSGRTRKNKGIIGRGQYAFDNDPSATQALQDIVKLYSHEDLSLLGIST